MSYGLSSVGSITVDHKASFTSISAKLQLDLVNNFSLRSIELLSISLYRARVFFGKTGGMA